MDTLLLVLAFAVLPVLPWIAGFWIVRHGPWRSRFWRGETVSGFTATAVMAAAIAGFLVGGVFLGQFGPPIGVLASLPVGILVGVLWGLQRARGRAA
jgi:hypothetical protein